MTELATWSHLHGDERVYHAIGHVCHSWENAKDPKVAEPQLSIGLNVIVDGELAAAKLFWELTEHARQLRGNEKYTCLSVSSSKMDDFEVVEPEEYSDEDTARKVRETVLKALTKVQGNIDRDTDSIISALMNAGILFRERR